MVDYHVITERASIMSIGRHIVKSCINHIETSEHILQCLGCENRKKASQNYLKNMQITMGKMGTNTTTIRVIITHLSAWLNKQNQPTMEEIAPDASVHLKEVL
jgi:hypothetical protein